MKKEQTFSELQELLIPGIIQYMTTVIIAFVVIHTGFLVLFISEKLMTMIIVEVLSLISYALLLHKLHYKITKYDTDILGGFITFVLVEVDLYMIIAAVLMGKACNFDNYVYGLLMITSFQFYITHHLKKDILLKSMIMVSYLGVRLYELYLPPIYQNYSPWVQTFFSFVNPMIVTSAIILFIVMVPVLAFNYEAQLVKKASVDTLTGLLNRSYTDKMLSDRDRFNLAILDIDDFKKVNDVYGHDNGDLVLKHLGEALIALERKFDNLTVIRWGGEEFVIVYRFNDDNKYIFLDILERLRKTVAEGKVELSNHEIIQYQITVGVAFSGEGESYPELLKIADRRLYYGKQHGKNAVVFSDYQ